MTAPSTAAVFTPMARCHDQMSLWVAKHTEIWNEGGNTWKILRLWFNNVWEKHIRLPCCFPSERLSNSLISWSTYGHGFCKLYINYVILLTYNWMCFRARPKKSILDQISHHLTAQTPPNYSSTHIIWEEACRLFTVYFIFSLNYLNPFFFTAVLLRMSSFVCVCRSLFVTHYIFTAPRQQLWWFHTHSHTHTQKYHKLTDWLI